MGCGKSKHAIETATTVIKSTNTDGTKQTTTATATKTVKETTTGSSLIQQETETKSLCVDDTNEKPVVASNVGKTNNVPPTLVAHVEKPDNVATTLVENVEKPADVLKEDVKDSTRTENVAPVLAENVGKAEEVVKEDEKVNSFSPANAIDVNNVVPTSSIDDVTTTEVIKEDEEKKQSTLKVDNQAETGNVIPIEEDKMKESYLLKDSITKTEFLTPTLSEDVVAPFGTAKGDDEVKDFKDEAITTTTSVKITEGPSNPMNDNLKVEERKASESIKLEVEKEQDAVVTEVDIKANISTAKETQEVSTANGANAIESQEKEP